MISICVPYAPEGSAQNPVEMEEIRWLRRETGQKELIVHRNDWGEWTISLKLPNDMYLDVAEGGSGERPEVNAGTVATIKNLANAAESDVLRKRLAREREMMANRYRRNLMNSNEDWNRQVQNFRKLLPGTSKDHPLFKNRIEVPGG